MTTNSEMFRPGGLYGCHTIVDSNTNQPVDVVAGMCVAIGMVTRWAESNPNHNFDIRASTVWEQNNAHLVQQESDKTLNFPE